MFSLALPVKEAIIEAKDKLTRLVDNEDDTYPVKGKMETAVAVMRTHAARYQVGLNPVTWKIPCAYTVPLGGRRLRGEV